MMTALLSFNQHFFLCEPCQKHFAKMLTAPEARAVNSKEALIMFIWKAHNEVRRFDSSLLRDYCCSLCVVHRQRCRS